MNDSPTLKEALLSQFHEQYAENYNNISSYVISFSIGMIAAFGALGWAVVNLLSQYKPTTQAFLLLDGALITVMGVLMSIDYICIKQGWAIRRDQFIVHAIRLHAFQGGLPKNMYVTKDVTFGCFPSEYHPFGKLESTKRPKEEMTEQERNGNPRNILIGMFNYLDWITLIAAYSTSAMAYVLAVFICWDATDKIPTCFFGTLIFALLFAFLKIHYSCLESIKKEYVNYQHQYQKYNPLNAIDMTKEQIKRILKTLLDGGEQALLRECIPSDLLKQESFTPNSLGWTTTAKVLYYAEFLENNGYIELQGELCPNPLCKITELGRRLVSQG